MLVNFGRPSAPLFQLTAKVTQLKEKAFSYSAFSVNIQSCCPELGSGYNWLLNILEALREFSLESLLPPCLLPLLSDALTNWNILVEERDLKLK